MTDQRLILNAHMNGLLAHLGGPVAVAALMEARLCRPYSAGTLSQKKNGHAEWTIMDMIVLQEAAGRAPVTDWLVSLDDDAEALPCRVTGVAHLAREHGEAINAVLTARTPEEVAKAIKELHDVRDQTDRLIDTMEAQA